MRHGDVCQLLSAKVATPHLLKLHGLLDMPDFSAYIFTVQLGLEVLEGEGISVRDKVDTYQPSEEFKERAYASMQHIIAPVITSLTGADGLDEE